MREQSLLSLFAFRTLAGSKWGVTMSMSMGFALVVMMVDGGYYTLLWKYQELDSF